MDFEDCNGKPRDSGEIEQALKATEVYILKHMMVCPQLSVSMGTIRDCLGECLRSRRSK